MHPAASPHRKAQDDMRLHLAIARATGSAVFQHLFARLHETIEAMLDYQRTELILSPEAEQSVARQQAAIVAAIRDHDPEAAAAAVRVHLDFIQELYRQAQAAAEGATSQAAE